MEEVNEAGDWTGTGTEGGQVIRVVLRGTSWGEKLTAATACSSASREEARGRTVEVKGAQTGEGRGGEGEKLEVKISSL